MKLKITHGKRLSEITKEKSSFDSLKYTLNYTIMKALTYFTICLFGLLTLSCVNEPIDVVPPDEDATDIDSTDPDSDVDDNEELVIKSVEISLYGDEDCTRHADFYEDGRIDIITWCYDGSTARDYFYSGNGLISGISGIGGFVYDGDVLVQRTTGSDTGSSVTNFTYNGRIVTSHGFYNGNPHNYETVYEFEDETYTRLLSITINDDVLTDPYVFRITSFEYENDLLIKSTHAELDEDTQQLEDQIILEYTYDDKINPYQQGLSQNALVTSFMVLFYYDSISRYLAHQMRHNVKTQKVTNLIHDYVGFSERMYVYNDDGYPISYIENVNDDPFRSVVLEYY